jgi:hypothetical protein
MSPVRQSNGSSQTSKIARQTSIGPTLQTERKAISPSAAAKKRRDFHPPCIPCHHRPGAGKLIHS